MCFSQTQPLRVIQSGQFHLFRVEIGLHIFPDAPLHELSVEAFFLQDKKSFPIMSPFSVRLIVLWGIAVYFRLPEIRTFPSAGWRKAKGAAVQKHVQQPLFRCRS